MYLGSNPRWCGKVRIGAMKCHGVLQAHPS